MRKTFRYLVIALLFLIIVATSAFCYVKFALPNVGAASAITIDYTPERVARGRYLANSVTVCMDCHSKRDFSKFAGPLTPGTFGMGGDIFDQSVGFPGVFYPSNITPEGIARYTDGELVRVITTGVSKEGKAMFPVMPYRYYGAMDTEDILSIVAYIRTLAPIKNNVPPSVPDFPVSVIINTFPEKADPHKKPDPSDVLATGQYLTNASGCQECHTPADKGQIIKEKAFSGGREFASRDGSAVASSNITPDDETGMGKWSKEAFVQRFKVYADSSYHPANVAVGEFNSPMPWMMYSQMTKDDLGAIYTYLKTLKPIPNNVIKFRKPS